MRGTCHGWRFRGGGAVPGGGDTPGCRCNLRSSSWLSAFDGDNPVQCRLDVAVAEQHAPANLVGADPPAVHPVVERHERDAQAAGRLVAGQIVRCLGGGFGVELPQLVAQRFANHLRELVGGHAAQKDFFGHKIRIWLMTQRKAFRTPPENGEWRYKSAPTDANRCHAEDTSSAVPRLWHSFASVGTAV